MSESMLPPIEHPVLYEELDEADQARLRALRQRGVELHDRMAVLAASVDPPEVLTDRSISKSAKNRIRIESTKRHGSSGRGVWFVAEVVKRTGEDEPYHKVSGSLQTFGINENGHLLPPDRELFSCEAREALLARAETFVARFEPDAAE